MWRGKVLLDFLDFTKSNITIDVGIIQITDYNRTCLYNSSDSNIIHYTNLGGYHLSFGSTAEKLFLKSRAMIQDDVGDYFNFLLDLANIKMTLLYNGVKTVKIVGSCAKINHIVNQNNYESKIIEINNLLNFLEIDFSKMLYLGKNTDVRLPGGHFNELAHERFALEMKDKEAELKKLVEDINLQIRTAKESASSDIKKMQEDEKLSRKKEEETYSYDTARKRKMDTDKFNDELSAKTKEYNNKLNDLIYTFLYVFYIHAFKFNFKKMGRGTIVLSALFLFYKTFCSYSS
jgi:hypothetical protein